MLEMSNVEGADLFASASACGLRMERIVDGPATDTFGWSCGNQLAIIRHVEGANGHGVGNILDHLGSVGRLNLKPGIAGKCRVSLGECMRRGKRLGAVHQRIRSGKLRA